MDYDDWATAHGVTGLPDEDDDLDELDNLLEYALGLDPLDPFSRTLPLASIILDGASELMSRDMRESPNIGIVPQSTVPIAATHPTRLDLDDDAVVIDGGFVDL